MRLATTYIKNVFCLEGEMGRDMRDRSSIKAAMNFMLQNFTVKFIYKQCQNRANMEYYINRWKRNKKYESYSICYLHFHGESGKIEPGGRAFVSFDELGEMLKDACTDKVIHFGTCETIKVEKKKVDDFLRKTKALCISGYRADVDFFESSVFDLIFIDHLQKFKSVAKVYRSLIENHPVMVKKLGFTMHYL